LLIDTQPPLTLESWKKEVDKMRSAYGCPLRAGQTAAVAGFTSHAENAPAARGQWRRLAGEANTPIQINLESISQFLI
jgi:hypothetical protein